MACTNDVPVPATLDHRPKISADVEWTLMTFGVDLIRVRSACLSCGDWAAAAVSRIQTVTKSSATPNRMAINATTNAILMAFKYLLAFIARSCASFDSFFEADT